MNLSLLNDWKRNALSFAGSTAQIKATPRRVSLLIETPQKTEPSLVRPPTSKLAISRFTVPLSRKLPGLFQAQVAVVVDEGKNPRSTSPAGKARAQVAVMVAPQVVRPEPCALKRGIKVRQNPLGVRFSDSELEIVKGRAKEAGCSVNGYIRAAALGTDYKQPHDPARTKALLATNRELTAQGSNINQIAKHMNAGKVHPTEAEGILGAIARSILQTHKAVRAALTLGRAPAP